MSKKLNIVVKLLSCIMALSLCLACFLLVDSPNSVKAEDTQVDASNVLYYVDAGTMSKNEDGSGDYATGYAEGMVYPSKVKTSYMTANDLDFGAKADDGAISGLYNSVTDKEFGEDKTTGKKWGFDKTAYSWYDTTTTYRGWRIYDTSSTTSGFEKGRLTDKDDGPLIYKFEVDDNTTALKIAFGTRYVSGWGNKNFNLKINGGKIGRAHV